MHALFAAALLAHRPHDEVASLAATADGRIVFAVVRSILYASGDGGDTWKLSNRGLPQLSAGYDKRYVPSTTIVLSSTFAEDLSAFLEMKSCDGAHSGLFATRDGGLNWFELENAPAIDPRARAAVAISTNFANDQTLLLAGADGMLHRSADAGRSFQPVGQLDCTVLKAVQRAFFCGSVDGGLFWSGASGTAWSQVLLSAGNGTDVTSMEEISSPIPSIPLVKEQEVVLLVSTTTHVYVTKFGRDTGALMLYRSILTADGVPTSTGYIGSSIFVVEQAHMDTPAPQLFPYLLAAFPNARVVHTVRDSLDWVEARTREWQAIKPGTALVAKLGQARNPASWLSKHQLASGEPVLPELSMSVRANRSERFAEAISFSAQNAYARCITPPSQYMLVNAFRGDMCRPGFLPQLAAFLNRSHGSGPKLTIPHC